MSEKEIVNEITGEIETEELVVDLSLEEHVDAVPTKEGDSLETLCVEHGHKFSDKDLALIAEKIVDLNGLNTVIQEEKKAAMADFNSRLKANEAEQQKLCDDYRRGEEILSTECYAVKDYDSGLMLFISVNDCSLIKYRELDNSERQLGLFDVSDEDAEFESEPPVCHMKQMKFSGLNDEGNEEWICSVCKSMKIVDPETGEATKA